jgi:hypothetical protein
VTEREARPGVYLKTERELVLLLGALATIAAYAERKSA